MSMSPEEYLAIPYVLVMESVEKEDGDWIRRAEYPELPGCVAEAFSPLDAIDQLEEKRVRFIMERLERGEPIPVPRPPLRAGVEGPDPAKLGFAKWLVDQNRLSDSR